ncbi:MAG: maleylpyruvate isomerase family mycothiol-dependent enzyme [Streptosporangiaceae bacterium]
MSHRISGPELAGLYRATRQRLTTLAAELDPGALAAPVPACPGWAVRDVLAHLCAIAEDTLDGRLSGVPTDTDTAAQVAARAGEPVPGILARWSRAAARFEPIIADRRVWPAVIDLASHEQDIRAALGMPGARDSEAVQRCSAQMLSRMRVPVPLRVRTEDGEVLAGPDPDPAAGHPDAALTLSTTLYEAFRWRMGRRSRNQMARLAWSGDPAPVLDHLAVFGPSATDIIE